MQVTFTPGWVIRLRIEHYKLSHTDRVVLWSLPISRTSVIFSKFQETDQSVSRKWKIPKSWPCLQTRSSRKCELSHAPASPKQALSIGHANPGIFLSSHIRRSVQLVPDSPPRPLGPFWGGEREYVGVIGWEKNERDA